MFQAHTRLALSVTLAVPLMALSQAHTVAPRTITVDEVTNAQVTVSPDGKTLLADIQGLIYAVPVAGGAAKRLTDPLQEASHPDWSRKGDVVALQCYAGGTFHIWTMKPDGSGLQQITKGHGDDREPRISPDGQTIVFASDRAFEGSYDIWTVPIVGGEPKRITRSEADEFGPTWSPDGKKIAFVSGTGISATSIQAIDVATGTQTQLLKVSSPNNRLEAPSWSPDGKTLAYVEFEAADIRSVNTGFLRMVNGDGTGTPVSAKSDDTFPFPAIWLSPKELIYTANGHILRMNVTANTATPIPFTAAIPYQPHGFKHKVFDFDTTAAKQIKGIYAPSLSPDGKSVAFVALNQVYVMPVGGTPEALTHDMFYKQGTTWSPDGTRLAYISDRDGIENVYVHTMADATDAGDKRIAPQQTAQIMPAWSPDGKTVAFQDQTGATLTADVASGTIKPLAPLTFFPGRASFSTNGKTVAIATIKPYTKRFREGTSSILTVDTASLKTSWYAPAPFESVTTRTEDGPTYSPNGKDMIFVMDDLLYAMPVDTDGHPSGPAVKLGDETADAPSISGDSKKILYLNNGKLHMLDRSTGRITPVAVNLTYTVEKPKQVLLIHAGRFWKGSGPDELKDVDILVTDNRITSVKPHSATAPAGVTRTIEAPNSTVLPACGRTTRTLTRTTASTTAHAMGGSG